MFGIKRHLLSEMRRLDEVEIRGTHPHERELAELVDEGLAVLVAQSRNLRVYDTTPLGLSVLEDIERKEAEEATVQAEQSRREGEQRRLNRLASIEAFRAKEAAKRAGK